MNEKTKVLIEDMLETMYDAGGVGLAAVQVGILKRIVVIDVTEEADNPIILINPVIVKAEGEQTGSEGCLSAVSYTHLLLRYHIQPTQKQYLQKAL